MTSVSADRGGGEVGKGGSTNDAVESTAVSAPRGGPDVDSAAASSVNCTPIVQGGGESVRLDVDVKAASLS